MNWKLKMDALKVGLEVTLANRASPGDLLPVSALTAPAVEYAFLFATSSGTKGLPDTKRASPVVSKTPLSMPIVVAASVPPVLNIPDANGAPLYATDPATNLSVPSAYGFSSALTSVCADAGELSGIGATTGPLVEGAVQKTAEMPTSTSSARPKRPLPIFSSNKSRERKRSGTMPR